MLGRINLWRKRSYVRGQLAVMNERELQDIGTCRANIVDEIGKPFWRKYWEIEMTGIIPGDTSVAISHT